MSRRPIYYDTETTGVKPDRDRITEIAAFDPVRNLSFCKLVNPEVPIPQECVQITGITDEMVKDQPNFAVIGKEFFDFCSGDVILIAHNNDTFDKHFLIHESKRAGLILPNFTYIDTLKWARKYRPDLPKHPLQYLREIYGIEANQAHRALDDVMVLYKIFSQMIDDLPIQEVYNLIYNAESVTDLRQMPFGKYKGEPLQSLPKHYLKWMNESGAFDKPENEQLKASLMKLNLLTLSKS
jgi:DNA polymerase-3 subunit epsilon